MPSPALEITVARQGARINALEKWQDGEEERYVRLESKLDAVRTWVIGGCTAAILALLGVIGQILSRRG